MNAVAPKQTEKQFQAAVVEYARLCGWKVFHPFDSRRSEPGWPDLTLVRGDRLIFAELKTETGTLTVEQQRWLDALRNAARHAVVAVWRPKHWPEIEGVLAG